MKHSISSEDEPTLRSGISLSGVLDNVSANLSRDMSDGILEPHQYIEVLMEAVNPDSCYLAVVPGACYPAVVPGACYPFPM